MKLEEIQHIMKQYDDLDTYVRKVFDEVAKARGVSYTYFEGFTIDSLGQVEVNYSLRSCGCCSPEYDSEYFSVDLLCDDLESVTIRLKQEADDRIKAENILREKNEKARQEKIRQEELNQLAKLQEKYKNE